MAAATGAASSPISRSLSSARLMAASISGMVVGPSSLGDSSVAALSAGGRLQHEVADRRGEPLPPRSSAGVSSSAASGSRRAMREATALDHRLGTVPASATPARHCRRSGVTPARRSLDRSRPADPGRRRHRPARPRTSATTANRTTGAMNTRHDACWSATAAGVESSAGSPGTITPRMTGPGWQERVPGMACRSGGRRTVYVPLQAYPAALEPLPPSRPRQPDTVTDDRDPVVVEADDLGVLLRAGDQEDDGHDGQRHQAHADDHPDGTARSRRRPRRRGGW